MQLTPNFELYEFRCGDEMPPPEVHRNIYTVAEQLQALRDHILRPIIITSGWRSAEHNRAVGGAPQSKHLQGLGVDIQVAGMKPRQLYDKILELMADGMMRDGGLGLYAGHVHYDLGPRGRRWGVK